MATLTAIFNAQDNLSKAMANAGNAGSKTSGIMQKLGKIGSVAMKGIITAVAAAGTALLAFGKKAVSVGMAYESSMSQVMATMGLDKSTEAGAKAYETLAAAAEHMGATTAFSTTEAADALNYLALAGYDAEKAAAALPTVLYLAGAGAMDLASASDMLTDAMSALQIDATQENLTEFSDKLAKTASSSNTSVAQLGEAVLAVGGTAANLKGGVTELTASLGILADAGIKGAEGGTHLRNMINSLQSGRNKDAANLFKKMGFSAYDAEGNMRSLGDQFKDINSYISGMDAKGVDNVLRTIFKQTDLAAARAMLAATSNSIESLSAIVDSSLSESGKSLADFGIDLNSLAQTFDPLMTQEQFAANMMQQFGLDAETAGMIFEGLNSVLSGTGTRFDELTEKIDDSAGACEQMYRTMLDNLQGDISIFNSTVEALYIEIFKATNGTLRDLVQTGTGYMQRLIDAFKAGGFSGLATELGNVLGDAVGVIMSYAPKLISAAVDVVSALVDSLGNNADTIAEAAVGIAMQLGSAILKIAPKLASAFVKVIGAAGKAMLNAIPKLFKSVPDSVYNALGLDKNRVVSAVTRFAANMKIALQKAFKGDFSGALDWIGKAFNLDDSTMGAIRNIATGIGNAFNSIKSAVLAVLPYITKFIGAFAKIGGIEAVIAGVAAGFAAIKAINVGKSIMSFAKGIKKAGGVMKILAANKFLLIAAAIAAVVAGIVLLVKNWDKVKAALKGGIDKVFGAGTFDKISSSLSKVGDTLGKMGGWAKDSFNKMKTAFNQGYQSGGLVGGIKAALASVGESLGGIDWAGIGSAAWAAVKSGFSATGDWIKQKVLGDSYTPDSTWGDVGSKIWETIKNGISATGDWLKEKLGYSPSDSWGTIGKDVWEKIKGGISATGDWLKEKLGYSPSDSWSTIGKSLWNKIKSGISATGDWLKTQLGYSPSDSWSTVGKSLWNKIKSGITATGDWLKEKLGYTPSDDWGTIGADIWNKIWDGITDTGEILKQKISDVLGKIPGFINELLGGGEAGAAGEGILTNIGESFKTSFENLTSYFEPLKTSLEGLWEKLQGIFTKLGPAIQTIGQVFLTIAKVIGTVVGAIVTWVVAAANGIINAVGPIVSYIVAGVGVILDIVSAVLSALGGDFAGAWESLKSAFQGVWTMIQNLWTAISGFFSGIWSVVQGVVNAIMGAFSSVGAAISGIWTGIVNGLINALNWCIDRINDLTSGLSSIWTWTGLEGIGEIGHIDPVEVPVTYVPENTADTSGGSASPVEVPVSPVLDTSSYGDQITAATDAVSQALSGTTLEFPEPDTSGFEAANTAVAETKASIEGMSGLELPDLSAGTSDLESLNSSITSATSGFADLESEISGIGDALSGLDLGTAGGEAGAGYMEGLANTDASGAASALTTNAENAVRAAQQSGSPAAAYMPIGAEAAQGYGQGLQQEDVSSFAQAFATAAMAAVTAATQAEAAALTLEAEGQNIIQTFATGMTAGSPTAKAVMTTLGVAIRAVAQAVNLTAQGLNMLRTLTNGMNSGRAAALSSARSTGSGIRSAFASINLTSTGSNIMRGLLNGMNSMFGSLLARARSMAAQLKSTIQSGMQVHSPSRFTEWVGEMTGQGLIDGIESMTSKATAAASNMVSSVANTFTPEVSASPTIASTSPYEAFGGDSGDASGSTTDRHIVLDIRGGGRIDVGGMTKQQAIDLISEQLKPRLQEILAEEIFTGGDSVYEF